MAESVLGTFRVEKELWNKFQGLAKSSGSNASQAIVGFIQACIDGNVDGSIDIKNYTNIKPKQKTEADNIDVVIDTYLDKNLDTYIHSYLDKNIDQLIGERLDKNLNKLKFEVATLSDSNKKTLLELSYQRGDIESLKTSSASTSDIPTLETIRAEINSAIGEVETYAESQFAKMREELAQLKKPLASVR